MPVHFATMLYDKWAIINDKTEDAMVASGDVGPRTYSVPYKLWDRVYVATFVGKKYRFMRAFVDDQKDTVATFTCTTYWLTTATVKTQDLGRTQPPQPDITTTPVRTVGTCNSSDLLKLTYGN